MYWSEGNCKPCLLNSAFISSLFSAACRHTDRNIWMHVRCIEWAKGKCTPCHPNQRLHQLTLQRSLMQ
jgi:hypothetical protein